MPKKFQPIEIQHVFNHLGMLFLYAPNVNNIYKDYILPFREDALTWPLELSLEDQLQLEEYHAKIDWDQACMQEAWSAVLGGPCFLKAPPYSSVYQDPEQVLYGQSYYKFKDFLTAQGLEFTLDKHIPEDHIGVMFLALGFLITENQESAKILLEDHLLPWSTLYLDLFETANETQYFYRFIARLAHASLDVFKTQWHLKLRDVKVYPYNSMDSLT